MKMKNSLTQDRLKELLDYNETTGILTWKVKRSNNVNIGDVAGGFGSDGYRRVKIDQIFYQEHRIIWLFVNGYFPENGLDHINRIKSDNCINNLREVSLQCNARNKGVAKNNNSGVTGICFNKMEKKWKAYIKDSHKTKHLGYFKNKVDAVIARWNAEVKYNFPNCNTVSSAYLYLQKKNLI